MMVVLVGVLVVLGVKGWGLTWGKTDACEVSVAAGTGVAGETTSTLRFCGGQQHPVPPSSSQYSPALG